MTIENRGTFELNEYYRKILSGDIANNNTGGGTGGGSGGSGGGGTGGGTTDTTINNQYYGWYTGGYGDNNGSTPSSMVSSIDRITYATDTNTASVRGSLTRAVVGQAASGNTTDGWYSGGLINDTGYSVTLVNRITYATDTNTASVRGSLSIIRSYHAAAGNSTDGWHSGGACSDFGGDTSSVELIIYVDDTNRASKRGNLSTIRVGHAASSNSTDGWHSGGGPASVDRITYATDTNTATVRGNLSTGRYGHAAAGNSTDGWHSGGYGGGISGGGGTNSTSMSLVDRITYATDTNTASVRGNLSTGRSGLAAAGNDTDGWYGGGNNGDTRLSSVDRITYATDTNTSDLRGSLTIVRQYHAAS
jgi:hypothetical protein